MKLVALYGRVSTTRQEVENQLRQMRAYCEKEGLEVFKEYVDVGVSGSGVVKPQYAALLEDASRKRFVMLLFWSLDRFSREGTLATLLKLNHLTSMGIGWKSYTEAFLDSAGIFKDVVISLLSTLAKQEKLRISERTRAAYQRKRALAKEKGVRLKWGREETSVDPILIERLRYEKGLSLRRIAEATSCSYGKVRNVLIKGGKYQEVKKS